MSVSSSDVTLILTPLIKPASMISTFWPTIGLPFFLACSKSIAGTISVPYGNETVYSNVIGSNPGTSFPFTKILSRVATLDFSTEKLSL